MFKALCVLIIASSVYSAGFLREDELGLYQKLEKGEEVLVNSSAVSQWLCEADLKAYENAREATVKRVRLLEGFIKSPRIDEEAYATLENLKDESFQSGETLTRLDYVLNSSRPVRLEKKWVHNLAELLEGEDVCSWDKASADVKCKFLDKAKQYWESVYSEERYECALPLRAENKMLVRMSYCVGNRAAQLLREKFL